MHNELTNNELTNNELTNNELTNNELTNNELTNNELILAIETSTDVCSVAFENAVGEIFEKRSEVRSSHSENLFLFVQELMSKHRFSMDDLSAVLVSEGPGSFTGLRIAASGVKGLLFDANTPLYAVSTLAGFATTAAKKHPASNRIHAIVDARRKHLFHQSFALSNKNLKIADKVRTVRIASLEKKLDKGDILIGTALARINKNDRKKCTCMGPEFISATALIHLFDNRHADGFIKQVNAADFDPHYSVSEYQEHI